MDRLAHVLSFLAQTSNPTGSPRPSRAQRLHAADRPDPAHGRRPLLLRLPRQAEPGQAADDLLQRLKPGQRVQTIGGILGTITQVNDKEVTVKVDETNNVKIKFARNAIHRVQDEDVKTETK